VKSESSHVGKISPGAKWEWWLLLLGGMYLRHTPCPLSCTSSRECSETVLLLQRMRTCLHPTHHVHGSPWVLSFMHAKRRLYVHRAKKWVWCASWSSIWYMVQGIGSVGVVCLLVERVDSKCTQVCTHA